MGASTHRKGPDEKEKKVFRAFMRREFNPVVDSDANILGIIIFYEDQKHKLMEEYRKFKEDMEKSQKYLKNFQLDLEDQQHTLMQTQQENEQLRAKLPHNSAHQSHYQILNLVAKELCVKSVDEIPQAINKMQQVFMTLPNIEKFIETVCKIVSEETVNPDLERILETIAGWKEQIAKLHQGMQASSSQDALDKADAIAQFCNLFEVANTPVKVVVEQVFYFVHEIKLFLGFARKHLGMGAGIGVSSVLEEISKMLVPSSLY